MIDKTEIDTLIGATAYDQEGSKLGKIGQVFLDDESGRPEFATVNTGLFGTSESFVPLSEALVEEDSVRVPFSKDRVKDAPHVEIDGGHLDQSEEDRLYEYYGRSSSGSEYSNTSSNGSDHGRDTSGRSHDDAMTRSEESLQVGTATDQTGRARLRKYVTTEMETQTVPVRKERAVVEREPITDANADSARGGPEISEDEHDVVLHEERPVVEKTVQPVERVRLGTETTTENETVTEEVRKEHIETDGDVDSQR